MKLIGNMWQIKRENIYKIPLFVLRILMSFIYCKIKIGYWDSTWRLHGLPLIQKEKNSKIIIGKNFVACSIAKKNTIGVNQKVIIKTINNDSVIIIGENVGVSGCTISASKSISIGNDTLIGSGVLITDSDAHSIHPDLRKESAFSKSSPIIIGNNVFIGARAIILKGITIGDGSVVGAGAVVTKNIPSMSIAVGNPARLVGSIQKIEKYMNCL